MSALMGTGGFLSVIKQIDTFPSTALFFFNQTATNVGDTHPVRQMTAGVDRWVSALLEGNGVATYAVHRNTGGSPSSFASLSFPRNAGTWYAMRIRFHSVSSRDVTIGSLANFAADTGTVNNDLSLHDIVKLGESLNGMLAEVGIFNGRAVPDAEYTSYSSGALLVENMTGVTFADSLLTFTNGSTTRTALTGQTLTVNGTITQGSSHPITRTTPVPVSFSGPVPTRNGVLGTASTFANAGFFAGNLTPFTYSSVGTALPAGVTLNTSTGVLSLAASGASAGTTSGIIIRATDTGGNIANTNAYSIVIAASNAAPTFPGNISNISGTAGSAITPVNVSGQFSDTDALTYSASPAGTAWPSGLVVNSGTGIISGTVASAGTTSGLKVRATDTASQTVDSNAFNAVIAAGSATRTWTPTIKLEALADETPFANWAVHALINDTAGNLIGTKTGLTTSSAGLPPPFTSSFGSLATDYRVTYVDDTDLTIFAIENLRCV